MHATLALLALIAVPEVELGLGASASDALAPVGWVRAGARSGLLGLSLHGLYVAGAQGRCLADGSSADPSGYQAWMLGPEVRLFTPGGWGFFGGGLGIGKLVSSNCSCSERLPAVGRLGFAGHAMIGGRIDLGAVYLAPELGALFFTHVDQPRGQWNQESHGGQTGLMLGLTLGWSGRQVSGAGAP